jgi:hypothetical protein
MRTPTDIKPICLLMDGGVIFKISLKWSAQDCFNFFADNLIKTVRTMPTSANAPAM